MLWLTGLPEFAAKLLPFLISRPILAGAGMLDGDGRFLLADKGPAINGVMGYGGFFHGRPIILLGDFYKRLAHDAIFAPQDFLDLFQPRQRLQIGIGDSNMCDARTGSAWAPPCSCSIASRRRNARAAAILRPIQALRAICTDTELGYGIET